MFVQIKGVSEIKGQDLYTHFGEVEDGELVFRTARDNIPAWELDCLLECGYLYHWVEQEG